MKEKLWTLQQIHEFGGQNKNKKRLPDLPAIVLNHFEVSQKNTTLLR